MTSWEWRHFRITEAEERSCAFVFFIHSLGRSDADTQIRLSPPLRCAACFDGMTSSLCGRSLCRVAVRAIHLVKGKCADEDVLIGAPEPRPTNLWHQVVLRDSCPAYSSAEEARLKCCSQSWDSGADCPDRLLGSIIEGSGNQGGHSLPAPRSLCKGHNLCWIDCCRYASFTLHLFTS